jgi:hypothetical protein
MQGTNRIYEEPSRLSQGLVIGLSIAVVVMAGWLAVTITLSQTPMTSVEGATDAAAGVPMPDGADASLPTTLRQPERSNSVQFDWPAEFASATSRSTPPPPSPVQTAMPPAAELPATRDLGRAPWLAAPDARDRSLPSRQPAGAATEATDAIVEILAPPPTSHAAAAAPPPRPAQAQRRQKPRVVATEAAAQ